MDTKQNNTAAENVVDEQQENVNQEASAEKITPNTNYANKDFGVHPTKDVVINGEVLKAAPDLYYGVKEQKTEGGDFVYSYDEDLPKSIIDVGENYRGPDDIGNLYEYADKTNSRLVFDKDSFKERNPDLDDEALNEAEQYFQGVANEYNAAKLDGKQFSTKMKGWNWDRSIIDETEDRFGLKAPDNWTPSQDLTFATGVGINEQGDFYNVEDYHDKYKKASWIASIPVTNILSLPLKTTNEIVSEYHKQFATKDKDGFSYMSNFEDDSEMISVFGPKQKESVWYGTIGRAIAHGTLGLNNYSVGMLSSAVGTSQVQLSAWFGDVKDKAKEYEELYNVDSDVAMRMAKADADEANAWLKSAKLYYSLGESFGHKNEDEEGSIFDDSGDGSKWAYGITDAAIQLLPNLFIGGGFAYGSKAMANAINAGLKRATKRGAVKVFGKEVIKDGAQVAYNTGLMRNIATQASLVQGSLSMGGVINQELLNSGMNSTDAYLFSLGFAGVTYLSERVLDWNVKETIGFDIATHMMSRKGFREGLEKSIGESVQLEFKKAGVNSWDEMTEPAKKAAKKNIARRLLEFRKSFDMEYAKNFGKDVVKGSIEEGFEELVEGVGQVPIAYWANATMRSRAVGVKEHDENAKFTPLYDDNGNFTGTFEYTDGKGFESVVSENDKAEYEKLLTYSDEVLKGEHDLDTEVNPEEAIMATIGTLVSLGLAKSPSLFMNKKETHERAIIYAKNIKKNKRFAEKYQTSLNDILSDGNASQKLIAGAFNEKVQMYLSLMDKHGVDSDVIKMADRYGDNYMTSMMESYKQIESLNETLAKSKEEGFDWSKTKFKNSEEIEEAIKKREEDIKINYTIKGNKLKDENGNEIEAKTSRMGSKYKLMFDNWESSVDEYVRVESEKAAKGLSKESVDGAISAYDEAKEKEAEKIRKRIKNEIKGKQYSGDSFLDGVFKRKMAQINEHISGLKTILGRLRKEKAIYYSNQVEETAFNLKELNDFEGFTTGLSNNLKEAEKNLAEAKESGDQQRITDAQKILDDLVDSTPFMDILGEGSGTRIENLLSGLSTALSDQVNNDEVKQKIDNLISSYKHLQTYSSSLGAVDDNLIESAKTGKTSEELLNENDNDINEILFENVLENQVVDDTEEAASILDFIKKMEAINKEDGTILEDQAETYADLIEAILSDLEKMENYLDGHDFFEDIEQDPKEKHHSFLYQHSDIRFDKRTKDNARKYIASTRKTMNDAKQKVKMKAGQRLNRILNEQLNQASNDLMVIGQVLSHHEESLNNDNKKTYKNVKKHQEKINEKLDKIDVAIKKHNEKPENKGKQIEGKNKLEKLSLLIRATKDEESKVKLMREYFYPIQKDLIKIKDSFGGNLKTTLQQIQIFTQAALDKTSTGKKSSITRIEWFNDGKVFDHSKAGFAGPFNPVTLGEKIDNFYNSPSEIAIYRSDQTNALGFYISTLMTWHSLDGDKGMSYSDVLNNYRAIVDEKLKSQESNDYPASHQQLQVIAQAIGFLQTDMSFMSDMVDEEADLFKNVLNIRGYAGAGKTTVIVKEILNIWARKKSSKKNILYVAPSEELVSDFLDSVGEKNKKNITTVLYNDFKKGMELGAYDLVIVDEASIMSDVVQADGSSEYKTIRDNLNKSNVKTLFLSDDAQVPDFQGNLRIHNTGLSTYQTLPLTEVYRTSNGDIAELQSIIRVNRSSLKGYKPIKGRLVKDKDGNPVKGIQLTKTKENVIKTFVQELRDNDAAVKEDLSSSDFMLVLLDDAEFDKVVSEYNLSESEQRFVKVVASSKHNNRMISGIKSKRVFVAIDFNDNAPEWKDKFTSDAEDVNKFAKPNIALTAVSRAIDYIMMVADEKTESKDYYTQVDEIKDIKNADNSVIDNMRMKIYLDYVLGDKEEIEDEGDATVLDDENNEFGQDPNAPSVSTTLYNSPSVIKKIIALIKGSEILKRDPKAVKDKIRMSEIAEMLSDLKEKKGKGDQDSIEIERAKKAMIIAALQTNLYDSQYVEGNKKQREKAVKDFEKVVKLDEKILHYMKLNNMDYNSPASISQFRANLKTLAVPYEMSSIPRMENKKIPSRMVIAPTLVDEYHASVPFSIEFVGYKLVDGKDVPIVNVHNIRVTGSEGENALSDYDKHKLAGQMLMLTRKGFIVNAAVDHIMRPEKGSSWRVSHIETKVLTPGKLQKELIAVNNEIQKNDPNAPDVSANMFATQVDLYSIERNVNNLGDYGINSVVSYNDERHVISAITAKYNGSNYEYIVYFRDSEDRVVVNNADEINETFSPYDPTKNQNKFRRNAIAFNSTNATIKELVGTGWLPYVEGAYYNKQDAYNSSKRKTYVMKTRKALLKHFMNKPATFTVEYSARERVEFINEDGTPGQGERFLEDALKVVLSDEQITDILNDKNLNILSTDNKKIKNVDDFKKHGYHILAFLNPVDFGFKINGVAQTIASPDVSDVKKQIYNEIKQEYQVATLDEEMSFDDFKIKFKEKLDTLFDDSFRNEEGKKDSNFDKLKDYNSYKIFRIARAISGQHIGVVSAGSEQIISYSSRPVPLEQSLSKMRSQGMTVKNKKIKDGPMKGQVVLEYVGESQQANETGRPEWQIRIANEFTSGVVIVKGIPVTQNIEGELTNWEQIIASIYKIDEQLREDIKAINEAATEKEKKALRVTFLKTHMQNSLAMKFVRANLRAIMKNEKIADEFSSFIALSSDGKHINLKGTLNRNVANLHNIILALKESVEQNTNTQTGLQLYMPPEVDFKYAVTYASRMNMPSMKLDIEVGGVNEDIATDDEKIFKINNGEDPILMQDSIESVNTEIKRLLGSLGLSKTKFVLSIPTENGEHALGMLHQSIMSLVAKGDNASIKVARHEAMHFIIEHMIDDATRKELFNAAHREMRARGISDTSYINTHEFLADMFMDQSYNEVNKRNILKRFFDWLSRIVNYFKTDKDYLKRFMQKVDSGAFSSATMVREGSDLTLNKIDNEYTDLKAAAAINNEFKDIHRSTLKDAVKTIFLSAYIKNYGFANRRWNVTETGLSEGLQEIVNDWSDVVDQSLKSNRIFSYKTFDDKNNEITVDVPVKDILASKNHEHLKKALSSFNTNGRRFEENEKFLLNYLMHYLSQTNKDGSLTKRYYLNILLQMAMPGIDLKLLDENKKKGVKGEANRFVVRSPKNDNAIRDPLGSFSEKYRLAFSTIPLLTKAGTVPKGLGTYKYANPDMLNAFLMDAANRVKLRGNLISAYNLFSELEEIANEEGAIGKHTIYGFLYTYGNKTTRSVKNMVEKLVQMDNPKALISNERGAHNTKPYMVGIYALLSDDSYKSAVKNNPGLAAKKQEMRDFINGMVTFYQSIYDRQTTYFRAKRKGNKIEYVPIQVNKNNTAISEGKVKENLKHSIDENRLIKESVSNYIIDRGFKQVENINNLYNVQEYIYKTLGLHISTNALIRMKAELGEEFDNNFNAWVQYTYMLALNRDDLDQALEKEKKYELKGTESYLNALKKSKIGYKTTTKFSPEIFLNTVKQWLEYQDKVAPMGGNSFYINVNGEAEYTRLIGSYMFDYMYNSGSDISSTEIIKNNFFREHVEGKTRSIFHNNDEIYNSLLDGSLSMESMAVFGGAKTGDRGKGNRDLNKFDKYSILKEMIRTKSDIEKRYQEIYAFSDAMSDKNTLPLFKFILKDSQGNNSYIYSDETGKINIPVLAYHLRKQMLFEANSIDLTKKRWNDQGLKWNKEYSLSEAEKITKNLIEHRDYIIKDGKVSAVLTRHTGYGLGISAIKSMSDQDIVNHARNAHAHKYLRTVEDMNDSGFTLTDDEILMFDDFSSLTKSQKDKFQSNREKMRNKYKQISELKTSENKDENTAAIDKLEAEIEVLFDENRKIFGNKDIDKKIEKLEKKLAKLNKQKTPNKTTRETIKDLEDELKELKQAESPIDQIKNANFITQDINGNTKFHPIIEAMYWGHYLANANLMSLAKGEVEETVDVIDYVKRAAGLIAPGTHYFNADTIKYLGKGLRTAIVSDIKDFNGLYKKGAPIEVTDGAVLTNPVLQRMMIKATSGSWSTTSSASLKNVYYGNDVDGNKVYIKSNDFPITGDLVDGNEYYRSALEMMLGEFFYDMYVTKRDNENKSFDQAIDEIAEYIIEETEDDSPLRNSMVHRIAYESSVKQGKRRVNQVDPNPTTSVFSNSINNDDNVIVMDPMGLRMQQITSQDTFNAKTSLPIQIFRIVGMPEIDAALAEFASNVAATIPTDAKKDQYIANIISSYSLTNQRLNKAAELLGMPNMNKDVAQKDFIQAISSHIRNLMKGHMPGSYHIQAPHLGNRVGDENRQLKTTRYTITDMGAFISEITLVDKQFGMQLATEGLIETIREGNYVEHKFVDKDSFMKLMSNPLYEKAIKHISFKKAEVMMGFNYATNFGIKIGDKLKDVFRLSNEDDSISIDMHDKHDEMTFADFSRILEKNFADQELDEATIKKMFKNPEQFSKVKSRLTMYKENSDSFIQKDTEIKDGDKTEVIKADNSDKAIEKRMFIRAIADYFYNFNKALDVYYVRIPTTNSSMGSTARIAAFIWDTRNTIYTSSQKNILDGSDYDADQMNVFYRSVDNNGNIVGIDLINKNRDSVAQARLALHNEKDNKTEDFRIKMAQGKIFNAIDKYYKNTENYKNILSLIDIQSIVDRADNLKKGKEYAYNLGSSLAMQENNYEGNDLVGHAANLTSELFIFDAIDKFYNNKSYFKDKFLQDLKKKEEAVEFGSQFTNAGTDNSKHGGPLGKLDLNQITSPLATAIAINGGISSKLAILTGKKISPERFRFNHKKKISTSMLGNIKKMLGGMQYASNSEKTLAAKGKTINRDVLYSMKVTDALDMIAGMKPKVDGDFSIYNGTSLLADLLKNFSPIFKNMTIEKFSEKAFIDENGIQRSREAKFTIVGNNDNITANVLGLNAAPDKNKVDASRAILHEYLHALTRNLIAILDNEATSIDGKEIKLTDEAKGALNRLKGIAVKARETWIEKYGEQNIPYGISHLNESDLLSEFIPEIVLDNELIQFLVNEVEFTENLFNKKVSGKKKLKEKVKFLIDSILQLFSVNDTDGKLASIYTDIFEEIATSRGKKSRLRETDTESEMSVEFGMVVDVLGWDDAVRFYHLNNYNSVKLLPNGKESPIYKYYSDRGEFSAAVNTIKYYSDDFTKINNWIKENKTPEVVTIADDYLENTSIKDQIFDLLDHPQLRANSNKIRNANTLINKYPKKMLNSMSQIDDNISKEIRELLYLGEQAKRFSKFLDLYNGTEALPEKIESLIYDLEYSLGMNLDTFVVQARRLIKDFKGKKGINHDLDQLADTYFAKINEDNEFVKQLKQKDGETDEEFDARQSKVKPELIPSQERFILENLAENKIREHEDRIRETFDIRMLLVAKPEILNQLDALRLQKKLLGKLSLYKFNTNQEGIDRDFINSYKKLVVDNGYRYSEEDLKRLFVEYQRTNAGLFLDDYVNPNDINAGSTLTLNINNENHTFDISDPIQRIKFGYKFPEYVSELSKKTIYLNNPFIQGINYNKLTNKYTVLEIEKSGTANDGAIKDMRDAFTSVSSPGIKELFRVYSMIKDGFLRGPGSIGNVIDFDLESRYTKWAKNSLHNLSLEDKKLMLANIANYTKIGLPGTYSAWDMETLSDQESEQADAIMSMKEDMGESTADDKIYDPKKITPRGQWLVSTIDEHPTSNYRRINTPAVYYRESPESEQRIGTLGYNNIFNVYSRKTRPFEGYYYDVANANDIETLHEKGKVVIRGNKDRYMNVAKYDNLRNKGVPKDGSNVILADGTIAKLNVDFSLKYPRVTLTKQKQSRIKAQRIGSGNKLMNVIIRQMRKSFPNLKIETINDPNGPIGSVDANGVVRINSAKVQYDTPVHELGHVFLAILKEVSPDIYNQLSLEVEAMIDSGHEVARMVQNAYPDLSADDLVEEIITTMLGFNSAEAVKDFLLEQRVPSSKAGKIYNSVSNFIKSLVDKIKTLIADLFGLDTVKLNNIDLQDISIGKLSNELGQAILSGKTISLVSSETLSDLIDIQKESKIESIKSVSDLMGKLSSPDYDKASEYRNLSIKDRLIQGIINNENYVPEYYGVGDVYIEDINSSKGQKIIDDIVKNAANRTAKSKKNVITFISKFRVANLEALIEEVFGTKKDAEGNEKSRYTEKDMVRLMKALRYDGNSEYMLYSQLKNHEKYGHLYKDEFKGFDPIIKLSKTRGGTPQISIFDMTSYKINEFDFRGNESYFAEAFLDESNANVHGLTLVNTERARREMASVMLRNHFVSNGMQVMDIGIVELLDTKYFYQAVDEVPLTSQLEKLASLKGFKDILSSEMKHAFEKENNVISNMDYYDALMSRYKDGSGVQQVIYDYFDKGDRERHEILTVLKKRLFSLQYANDRGKNESIDQLDYSVYELTELRMLLNTIRQLEYVSSIHANQKKALGNISMYFKDAASIGEENIEIARETIHNSNRKVVQQYDKYMLGLKDKGEKEGVFSWFFNRKSNVGEALGYDVSRKIFQDLMVKSTDINGKEINTGHIFWTTKDSEDPLYAKLAREKLRQDANFQKVLDKGRQIVESIDNVIIDMVKHRYKIGKLEIEKNVTEDKITTGKIREILKNSGYKRGMIPIVSKNVGENVADRGLSQLKKSWEKFNENVVSVSQLYDDFDESLWNNPNELFSVSDMFMEQFSLNEKKHMNTPYGNVDRFKKNLGIHVFRDKNGSHQLELVNETKNQDMSYDLERILGYFFITASRVQVHETETLPVLNAIKTLMTDDMLNRQMNNKAALEYLNMYEKQAVRNQRNTVKEKLFGKISIDKSASYLMKGASFLTMTLNTNIGVLSMTTNALQAHVEGITNSITRALGIDNPFFGEAELMKATARFFIEPHKMTQLAMHYGVVNAMDYERVHHRLWQNTKKTVLSDHYVNLLNWATDFYARSVVMAAQMMYDGSYDAHTYNKETGEIEYDAMQDKRYSNDGKTLSEEGKILAAYKRDTLLIHNLQDDDKTKTVDNVKLPSLGYDNNDSATLKYLADRYVIGAYDMESKTIIGNFLGGRLFNLFHNYAYTRIQNAFKTGEYTRAGGRYVVKEVKDEVTGQMIKVPKWERIWLEGYFNTFFSMAYNVSTGNFDKVRDMNDWQKRNLVKMAVNLAVFMGVNMLFRALFRGDNGDPDKDRNNEFLGIDMGKAENKIASLRIFKNIQYAADSMFAIFILADIIEDPFVITSIAKNIFRNYMGGFDITRAPFSSQYRTMDEIVNFMSGEDMNLYFERRKERQQEIREGFNEIINNKDE